MNNKSDYSLKFQNVLVFILNVFYSILHFLMRRSISDNLSADDFLCLDGIACQLIELLLGCIPLCEAKLSLDLILNEVLELSLNLL